MIACYNLALAYEMKDNLDKASDCLLQSFKLAGRYGNQDDRQSIVSYRKIIEKRKKDLEKLKS